MVSVDTIISVLVTLFIVVGVPISAYIMYGIKNKGKGVWIAWLLGAAGFFVMQIIIRVPVLSVVQMIPGFNDFVINNYVLYCGILAVTAAGFELAGRFIVAKIMSKSLTYEKSFAAGLGHGGIESIFLIGSTYLNNIIYIIMINTGVFDKMIVQLGTADASGTTVAQLEAIKNALINTSSATFYLAGYERVLTMIIHLAMTLVVCWYIKENKPVKGIVLCMLVHTMVDFVTPILSALSTSYMGNIVTTDTSYVLAYVFLTMVAIGCIVIIKIIKDRWKKTIVEQ